MGRGRQIRIMLHLFRTRYGSSQQFKGTFVSKNRVTKKEKKLDKRRGGGRIGLKLGIFCRSYFLTLDIVAYVLLLRPETRDKCAEIFRIIFATIIIVFVRESEIGHCSFPPRLSGKRMCLHGCM